jgi:hypothetical protein
MSVESSDETGTERQPPGGGGKSLADLVGAAGTLLAVVVALAVAGLAPSAALVIAGFGIGISMGCALSWMRLHRSGYSWPSASAVVVAVFVLASGLFVLAYPLLHTGRMAPVDGGPLPWLSALLVSALLGTAPGYWLDWVQARSVAMTGASRRAPSSPRAESAAAIALAALVLVAQVFLTRTDEVGGPPRCPESPGGTGRTSSAPLLQHPLVMHEAPPDQARECYQAIAATALAGKTIVYVTYDLHGLKALGKDASALIIDQGNDDSCFNAVGCRWHYVSLSDYGTNGMDGLQTVAVALSAFPGLRPAQPVNGVLHTRWWSSGGTYRVDITSVRVT